MSITFDQILEVEDSLRDANVFINGISGKPSHSDSYMTIVDFAKLEEWFAKKEFTNDQLKYCVEYWSTNSNNQPPLKLVSGFVGRKIDKKNRK